MSEYDELAKRFEAQAQKLSDEAKTKIKELFLKTKLEYPEITNIRYCGEPNSYNDEGMACEGRVEIHTEELDKAHSRTYGNKTLIFYDDNSEGVWSDDDENGCWDEKTHPMSLVAKEIYNKISSLNTVVGYNGYFDITA
jgi:hypothetical protein